MAWFWFWMWSVTACAMMVQNRDSIVAIIAWLRSLKGRAS